MMKYSHIVFKKPTAFRALSYRHLLQQPSMFMSSEETLIKPNRFISFKEEFSVKRMTKSDLGIALCWAEQEGWNPGRHELDALYSADPTGYYMLYVDGEPIASLACVRHSDRFAFLGLFIVLPKFRYQGYGQILWNVVLSKAAIFDSLGLNAVMNQIYRYKKSGFLEHSLITRCKLDTTTIPRIRNFLETNLILSDTVPHEKILNYDAKFFGSPRKLFLRKWLEMPESRTLVALSKEQELLGYATISCTDEGYKIAPFIADDSVVADSLYKGFCYMIGNQRRVFIDIPHASPCANKLVEQFKMEKMFDTMRMYRGVPKLESKQKIIGEASLEIGY